MNESLSISKIGINIIEKYEGFIPKPYLDAVGIPTIGIGSISHPDGRRVSMKDSPISLETAQKYLMHEVEKVIYPTLRKFVKVQLNQNQFDSLCSFCYNVGTGAFQKSTMLRKINAGDFEGASKEFIRWNKAGGKELAGLTKRRKSESFLFSFKGTPTKLVFDSGLNLVKIEG